MCSRKSLIPAAVLLPLVYENNAWHLLFIRRAVHEADRHSGQVAFPGGRIEPEDMSPMHGALRETEEEVGIKTELISIIGELPALNTGTNYLVYPFVGYVSWPTPLILDKTEVAHTFTIPYDWLKNKDNYQYRTYKSNHYQSIFFKPYGGETLWGASAKMTLTLVEAINQGKISLPKP